MATITAYGSKHSHEFKLEVKETSTSTANNTSEISYKLTLYKSSYSWSGFNSITYTITINGQTYTGTISSYSAGSTLTIKSGNQTVTHNSDGSKTINYSFSITDNSGQSYTCGNASASGSLKLTTIPRASSVSATAANIEENTTIKITRASSSFTHTLKYSFSGLTGTIVSKTSSTSVNWTLPSSFYEKIPNSKTGTVTITCETYSGNTLIGSKTCTFTVTASQSRCKPTLTASIVDINEDTLNLTGDEDKLIRYRSTALLSIVCESKNSATIRTKVVNGTSFSGDNIQISQVTTGQFVVTVTDSRGYSTSETITKELVEYIEPTASVVFERRSPTSDEFLLSFNGNCYNGSFGDESNVLYLKWRYKEKDQDQEDYSTWSNLTPVLNDNTYSNGVNKISLGSIFDYKKAYTFQFYYADKLSESITTIEVAKGEPVFNWGEDFFNINGDLLIEGSPIIDIVEDGDKKAIKFANGILINTIKTSVSGLAINNAWGVLYASNSIYPGDWAVPFTNIYSENTSFYSSNMNAWVILFGNVMSLTTASEVQLVRPTSVTTSRGVVSVTAIGTWK